MTSKTPSNEHRETEELVKNAFDLARALKVQKVVVQADELQDIKLIESLRQKESIIWLVREAQNSPSNQSSSDVVIKIPETGLTRFSQLNLGLFRGVLNGHLELEESVICLSGVAGSEKLDTLLITNPGRDFPWFGEGDMVATQNVVASREFGRLIDIALKFAAEGREGKPIGTVFVLGDIKELRPYLRQLILNPCQGHPPKTRNIHNQEFLESLREFAALDGAFVVNTKGVVESAGTYLDANVRALDLAPGLGARHAAAAAITDMANAVAVVISESSGRVTFFHRGEAILELEKPTPVPLRKRSAPG